MITKINKIILITLVSILPIFFYSAFAHPDLPKILLISLAIILLFVLVGIEVAIKGTIKLNFTKVDIPAILLVLVVILSGILKTPNKMEAFFLPGSVTIFILCLLVFFFINKIFKDKELLINSLVISSFLVSFLSLLSFLGKKVTFSPVGGKLPETIFLLVILPLGINFIFSKKKLLAKIIYGVLTLVTLITITINISLILSSNQTASLVLSKTNESLTIAMKAIKESPIFGFGVDNYQSAFSKFVPLSHNSTQFWSIKFTSASSFALTFITETGILGGFAFLLITFYIVRNIILNRKEIENISLAILLICLFVLPTNITLIFLFFILLSISFDKNKEFNLKVPKLASPFVFFVLGILVFLAARSVSAELIYKKGLDAISQNNGKLAYDSLKSAIELNPHIDRYHLVYSQVNLALAQNISNKSDVTEEEKNTVAQLIQQAIREGKAAVSLNPERSTNWESLARTYQAIIPFAQGASQFTIDAYNQAIALDPINPNLRISLGSIYYALGQYDEAIKIFEAASLAKPDLANSYYNLAIAYKAKGDMQKTDEYAKKALSLLDSNSPEYQKVKNELQDK